MTLSMNGRDQMPFNKPTFEPVEMPLGKHIKSHVKKLEETENIDQLLLLVINMCALLGSQGKMVSKQALAELLPKITEKTKISASTWNDHTVYVLAGIGALVSIGSGVYTTYGSVNALLDGQAMIAREANALGLANVSQLPDLRYQALQQQITNAMQKWTGYQSVGGAVGQAFTTGKELRQNYTSSERQLVDHDIERLKFKRDNTQQASGSLGHKADQAVEMAQQAMEKNHRAKNGG